MSGADLLVLIYSIVVVILMVALLARSLRRRRHRPHARPAGLALFLDRQGADVPVQVRDNQRVHYVLSELDSRGNPVSGGEITLPTPTWSLDRDDLLSLEVSDDGLQANLSAVGGLGDTVVTVQVQLPDEDDGAGGTTPGKLLQGSDVISVIGDDVVASIGLTPDQIVDQ